MSEVIIEKERKSWTGLNIESTVFQKFRILCRERNKTASEMLNLLMTKYEEVNHGRNGK